MKLKGAWVGTSPPTIQAWCDSIAESDSFWSHMVAGLNSLLAFALWESSKKLPSGSEMESTNRRLASA